MALKKKPFENMAGKGYNAVHIHLEPLITGVLCISYSKNSQVQNSDGSSSPNSLRASADNVTFDT